MKCKFCQEELKDNLAMAESGEMIHKVSLDSKGNPQFEYDEFNRTSEIAELFCKNCGESIGEYDEDLAKKLLREEAR